MPAVTDVHVKSLESSTPRPIDWLERYGESLYAFAMRRVRRPDVAEDLLQETLLAGLAAWESFGERSQVRTWLTGILSNKIVDHQRARFRHPVLEAASPEEHDAFDRRGRWKMPVRKWSGDPRHLVEQKELGVVLDACVSKLPQRMAHLFISRVIDETETLKLCEQLEITPENAWALLHRARLRLRQCLTVNWFDEAKPAAKRKKNA